MALHTDHLWLDLYVKTFCPLPAIKTSVDELLAAQKDHTGSDAATATDCAWQSAGLRSSRQNSSDRTRTAEYKPFGARFDWYRGGRFAQARRRIPGLTPLTVGIREVDEHREAIVHALYDSMISKRLVMDLGNNVGTARWITGAWYDEERIEASCWHLVAEVLNLYEHGTKITVEQDEGVVSPEDLKDGPQARIEQIHILLRQFTAAREAVMTGNIDMLIYKPRTVRASMEYLIGQAQKPSLPANPVQRAAYVISSTTKTATPTSSTNVANPPHGWVASRGQIEQHQVQPPFNHVNPQTNDASAHNNPSSVRKEGNTQTTKSPANKQSGQRKTSPSQKKVNAAGQATAIPASSVTTPVQAKGPVHPPQSHQSPGLTAPNVTPPQGVQASTTSREPIQPPLNGNVTAGVGTMQSNGSSGQGIHVPTKQPFTPSPPQQMPPQGSPSYLAVTEAQGLLRLSPSTTKTNEASPANQARASPSFANASPLNLHPNYQATLQQLAEIQRQHAQLQRQQQQPPAPSPTSSPQLPATGIETTAQSPAPKRKRHSSPLQAQMEPKDLLSPATPSPKRLRRNEDTRDATHPCQSAGAPHPQASLFTASMHGNVHPAMTATTASSRTPTTSVSPPAPAPSPRPLGGQMASPDGQFRGYHGPVGPHVSPSQQQQQQQQFVGGYVCLPQQGEVDLQQFLHQRQAMPPPPRPSPKS